ncbi:hypothetical protein REIS_0279 [Rickettsia endosymbiont of Ixodes scapularis]|nr:hypothetical protein REIS_0279 [Rickettsia endosymbiont of Ixodes scapularis]
MIIHHIPLKQDNGIISCGNPVITFFNASFVLRCLNYG